MNKYNSAELQIDAIVDYLVQSIRQLLETKDEICIAVSGGKSPIGLFEKLSRQSIDWAKVTITLVDERFIDTNNQDSNENLVKTYLLKNKAKEAKFIGLSNTNMKVDSVIDHLNATMPKIDIAILGMGEDGHTASIFPCCSELERATNLSATEKYIATKPTTANYQRIGLNLSALVEIPHLILSINGNKKLEVLEKSLTTEKKQPPIGLLLSNRPDTKIFWSE